MDKPDFRTDVQHCLSRKDFPVESNLWATGQYFDISMSLSRLSA
jgi:hypothetical protein